MVSFTSRNPSFFSTAMSFSGLLLLALGLHGSSSPLSKRQAAEEDPTVDIRKELYWGMRLLILRNNHHDGIFTNMNITKENLDPMMTLDLTDNDNLTTSISVMCDMHDFYRDYSTALANIQPNTDTSLHVKADYSAAQYVALKNMQSACEWTNSASASSNSSVSIDGCTLSSISTTCYIVRYHRMVNQTETIFANPNPKPDWNGSLGCNIDIS